jgi:hypothetical protein
VGKGAPVTAQSIRSAILQLFAENDLDPARLHLLHRYAADYTNVSEVSQVASAIES